MFRNKVTKEKNLNLSRMGDLGIGNDHNAHTSMTLEKMGNIALISDVGSKKLALKAFNYSVPFP